MMPIVVDKRALLENMENDAVFLKNVIGVFLADYPSMLAEIHGGAATGDPVRIMNAAHALRGSVSLFGAKNATAALQLLEVMGKEGKLEGVNQAVCMLEGELALVSLALKEIATDIV
jgi:two-component system sensor histidine kinase/response regulator